MRYSTLVIYFYIFSTKIVIPYEVLNKKIILNSTYIYEQIYGVYKTLTHIRKKAYIVMHNSNVRCNYKRIYSDKLSLLGSLGFNAL